MASSNETLNAAREALARSRGTSPPRPATGSRAAR